MSKTRKVTIAIVAAVVTMAIAAILIPWGSIFKERPSAHELELEKQSGIYYYRSGFLLGRDLRRVVSLDQSTDADGTTFYTVRLVSGAEEILGEMVDAYDTIPGMQPITIGEVTYCLTDGMLLESTDQWAEGSAFRQFITWCDAYASTPPDPEEGSNTPVPEYPERPLPGWELVYKDDRYDADGNKVIVAGDPVILKIDEARATPITNYDYFMGKDNSTLYADVEYAWQYNEKHPDNPVVAP
jgi:hypothetical protein